MSTKFNHGIAPFARGAALLAAMALLACLPARSQTYNWNGPDNGDWTTSTNWDNTLPGTGDTAVFSDSTAGATVNLDSNVTVGGLHFNNQVANQTIASTGGFTLTLGGGTVAVDVGTLTISCPIDATANGLYVSGGGVLNIGGALQTTYGGGWETVHVRGIALSGTGS